MSAIKHTCVVKATQLLSVNKWVLPHMCGKSQTNATNATMPLLRQAI
jgi:hypothetical protein